MVSQTFTTQEATNFVKTGRIYKPVLIIGVGINILHRIRSTLPALPIGNKDSERVDITVQCVRTSHSVQLLKLKLHRTHLNNL